MTHRPDVDYFDYVRKIKTNPYTVKIKLADLAHNSDDSRANAGIRIDKDIRKKMLAKYEKARSILIACD